MSSGSHQMYQDVDDGYPTEASSSYTIESAPGSRSQRRALPSANRQLSRTSEDTVWDEPEYQRQAVNARSSKYSVATRYDEDEGAGDSDDSRKESYEASSESHARFASMSGRPSSVSSSLWAGRGVAPFAGTTNIGSPSQSGSSGPRSVKKRNAVEETPPPVPTDNAAYQHHIQDASFGPRKQSLSRTTPELSSTSGYSEDDRKLMPSADSDKTPTTPVKLEPGPFLAASSDSQRTSIGALRQLSTDSLHPEGRHPSAVPISTLKGRESRSSVLSYDAGAAEEEEMLNTSREFRDDDDVQNSEPQDVTLDSKAAGPTSRRISHLGPRVRKNAPAPWEVEDEEALTPDGRSMTSSPFPSSPSPWFKRPGRASTDVREREPKEAKKALGLGVTLKRPSMEGRRVSSESASKAEAEEMAAPEASVTSNGERGRSEFLTSPASLNATTFDGMPSPSAAGYSSNMRPAFLAQPPSIPSMAASLDANDRAQQRTRTKSVSNSAANALRGLGFGGGGSSKAKGGDAQGQSNKLVKSLKKKGERNELSLAQGISSEAFANASEGDVALNEAVTEPPQATRVSKQTIAEINKHLVNPFSSAATSRRGISSQVHEPSAEMHPAPSGLAPSVMISGVQGEEVLPRAAAPHVSHSSSAVHERANGSSTIEQNNSSADLDGSSSSLDGSYNQSRSTDATSVSQGSIRRKEEVSGVQQALRHEGSTTPGRSPKLPTSMSPASSSHSSSSNSTSSRLAPGFTYKKSQNFGAERSGSVNHAGLAMNPLMFPPRSPSTTDSAMQGTTPTASASQPSHQALPVTQSRHAEGVNSLDSISNAQSGAEGHDTATITSTDTSASLGSHSTQAPPRTPRSDALPTPGSHEGVSYTLISLAEAQAQAKSKQQEAAARRQAKTRTSTAGHSNHSMEDTAYKDESDFGAGSGEHASSGATIPGSTSKKSLRNKKSGLLRIFNRGSDHIDAEDVPPVPAPFPGGPQFGSRLLPKSNTLKSMDTSDKMQSAAGKIPLDSAALPSGPSVPELGSIRPMSSMFSSLSPELLQGDQSLLATLSEDDPSSEATAGGAEQQKLPAKASLQRRVPEPITPTPYRASDSSLRTPNTASTKFAEDESSHFHSPAASPSGLHFPEQPNGTGNVGLGLNAMPPTRPLRLVAKSRNFTDPSTATRSRSVADDGDDLTRVPGGRDAPATASPLAGHDRPELTAESDASAPHHLQTRIASLEKHISALVAELNQLRAMQSVDALDKHSSTTQITASGDPPTGSNGADGTASASEVKLALARQAPSCQSCGCNCAELRRIQAANESSVLKTLTDNELNSSASLSGGVLDRGRGVKKRAEEASTTRFA